MANLYLVARPEDDVGYDDYDSFVVVATSAEAASLLSPEADNPYDPSKIYHPWTSSDKVTAKEIGIYTGSDPVGTVILASFNAG